MSCKGLNDAVLVKTFPPTGLNDAILVKKIPPKRLKFVIVFLPKPWTGPFFFIYEQFEH